jgi:GDPmannose 4,6-dehydratase
MKKTALITGVTGQDGSYLAELLLSKHYAVHGLVRRSSSPNTKRVAHLLGAELDFTLHYGDLCDAISLNQIVKRVQPDEIYNLAAQSDVGVSFELPEYTADVNSLGCLRLLEAVRACDLTRTVKFYQASTSELFGKVREIPQNEQTPFCPRSPYAAAKQFAYWLTVNYREAYGMFAVNGILFNHESPRRGHNFVTRKTTLAAGRIKNGTQKCLYLGNLDAKRDWGHAKDYVRGMWLMLQGDDPEDFVISTEETHTVREFVELAFRVLGMHLKWSGRGREEVGTADGKVVVRVDAKFFRPTEVDILLGDCSAIKKKLNWAPEYSFQALVEEMTRSDSSGL